MRIVVLSNKRGGHRKKGCRKRYASPVGEDAGRRFVHIERIKEVLVITKNGVERVLALELTDRTRDDENTSRRRMVERRN